MINSLALIAAAGALFHQVSDQHICVPTSQPKAVVEKQGGVWEELSVNQWQFLRGIYAVVPSEPRGLPPGSGAVLASKPGEDSGMVFFIDGANACDPLDAPKQLIELMMKVKSGWVGHEGDGT